jgi:hypothetical protein
VLSQHCKRHVGNLAVCQLVRFGARPNRSVNRSFAGSSRAHRYSFGLSPVTFAFGVSVIDHLLNDINSQIRSLGAECIAAHFSVPLCAPLVFPPHRIVSSNACTARGVPWCADEDGATLKAFAATRLVRLPVTFRAVGA